MFRGGKLSFLNNKEDDRIKIINDRVNLTEKHFIELCTTFSAYARKMAKYRDSYDELGQKMKSYADDESINESLSEGMRNFTKAVTIVGDYMDLQMHRLEAKIVSELSKFENACKTTRDKLRNAVVIRDREVLKQRQMLEMKAKFSASNVPADAELLKAKLDVNRSNKEIDDIINTFEKRKLTDLKTVLTDFILIQLKFHTKTLEALSASYYDMTNINEKYDLMEFEKLMKISEEPTPVIKHSLKKGATASISMDSLDMLSPRNRKTRLLRVGGGGGTSAISKTDDEDESDAESDEDDTEDSEDNSGTVSENEASDRAEPKKEKLEKRQKNKVKKVKSKTQIKQPFRAQALTTNKLQSKNLTKVCKTSSGVGIPKQTKGDVIKRASATLIKRTSSKSLEKRRSNKFMDKNADTKLPAGKYCSKGLLDISKSGGNDTNFTTSSQVTFVKSKPPLKTTAKSKRKADKSCKLHAVKTKKLTSSSDAVTHETKSVRLLKI